MRRYDNSNDIINVYTISISRKFDETNVIKLIHLLLFIYGSVKIITYNCGED